MSAVSEILLRRRGKAILSPSNPSYEQTIQEKALAVAVMKNMEAYGFCASKELSNRLLSCTREELTDFYTNLKPAMETLSGGDHVYEPMYPNFPDQVMNASDAELFINAFFHYLSFGTIVPEYEKDPRLPLIDSPDLTSVKPGDEEDLKEILYNLASSGTSLPMQDKNDMKILIDSCSFPFPKEVPNKENAAFLANVVWEKNGKAFDLRPYCKTPTDILRLAAQMSGGDTSLAEKTKFRKMSRKERRMIVSLLSAIDKPAMEMAEDMYRYQTPWIRLGEIVHPGEFKKYWNVNAAFKLVREGPKPLFFEGQLRKALDDRDTKRCTDLLRTRPGEFARNLDKVLRDAKDPESVLDAFSETANRVSPAVLLQAREHFLHRNEEEPYRVFFPKGQMAHAVVIPNTLPALSEDVCQKVALICEKGLKEQFSSKSDMGAVYIDPEMANFAVPSGQRSADASSRTMTRGSRISISKDIHTLRDFIWWTNTDEGRVDLDLSVSLYNEEWKYPSHVSYTRLRDPASGVVHSGDIINGGPREGKGAAEFIDVNLDKAEKAGCRYAVFQIFDYTGIGFKNLPHARFGWMEREDAETGEIFEPSTVKTLTDLNTENTVCIPAVLDVKERELIWCDLGLTHVMQNRGGNNLESNLNGVTAACYGICHSHKPNLYDLIRMNAEARGEITDSRDKANIIFSNDSTPPAKGMVNEEGVPVQVSDESVPIFDAFCGDVYFEMLNSGSGKEEGEPGTPISPEMEQEEVKENEESLPFSDVLTPEDIQESSDMIQENKKSVMPWPDGPYPAEEENETGRKGEDLLDFPEEEEDFEL